MQEIKLVLNREISEGLINWEKLEQKIHASLNMVDNKFKSMRQDGVESEVKFKDSLMFFGKYETPYRLIKPRFLNGKLVCSGKQIGYKDFKGNPFFPNPPVVF